MSENNQEPSFDAAPQNAGGVSGTLKGVPQHYKRLNPTVKNLIIFGVAAIVGLILFAIMSVDNSPKLTTKSADKPAAGTMQGTVPKSVADAPNGVPSASAAGEAASNNIGVVGSASSGAQPTTPGLTGHEGMRGRAVDDLAGASQQGGGLGGAGAYPDHQPREKTAAELRAERQAMEREEALKSGADSGLTGQQDASAAARAQALPTVPGLSSAGGGGANQPAAMVSSAEDPNKQVRKEQFLKDASVVSQLGSTLLQTVQQPISPYEINGGWLIPATMASGMNSDLPGQLRAVVRENVRDSATGQYVLIPRGATLIGTYDSQVAFGQSRVLVVWSRVIFPDGSSLALQGMPAADEQGFAGLTGDVNNHMWPIIKAAVFMSVISAGAQLSQPQSTNSNGSYGAPTAGQQLAAALGQQLGQAGSQLFARYLNVQPTITTDPGTKFNILVTKDIVFPREWKWSK